MFVFIILTITVLRLTEESPCISKACTGPYALEMSSPPKIQIEESHQRLDVFYTQPAKVHIGYRSRYTAYCYQGGALDPNTGCDKITHPHPPSGGELLAWGLRGECNYGIECDRGGDCWGSNARVCFDETTDRNWAKEKEYVGNQNEWYLFPYHTCLSTWRCGIWSGELPVFVSLNKDSSPMISTIDRNGKQHSIFPRGKQLIKIDSTTNLYIPEQEILRQEHRTEAQCFGGKDLDDIYCHFQHPVTKNYIIVQMFNGQGCLESLCVAISDVPGAKLNFHKAMEARLNQIKKAASIEDLRAVALQNEYQNREYLWNLAQIYLHLTDLEKRVLEIVRSSAKVDDELIGRMLGHRTRTKWYNNDLFHLCPCYNVPMDKFSNCAEKFIYSSGRIIDRTKTSSDLCSTYSPESVQNITLIKNSNISISRLDVPPAAGSASSWDGWSWLAERKEDLLTSMTLSTQIAGGGSQTVIGQLYQESVGFFNFSRVFHFIGSGCGMLALVLVLVCRR
uniref:Envelope glycoprotein n=1 Tax=Oba virus TaxID=2917765 RepID=A0AA86IYZ7_9ORTO|nr:envelope glycoprotein [Oba virus]